MNPSNHSLTRPTGFRWSLGLFAVLASVTLSVQAATEAVTLKLGGKKFGHGVNLNANSGTWQVAKSKLYHYKISGTIKGKGGKLGEIYSQEMPLETFLDSLKQGTSALLEGPLENPDGALPAKLVSLPIEGARNIKGLGRVNLKLNLVGAIASNGQVSLEVTGVKATINGVPLDGVMKLGKGSKLEVTTAPIVEFKAKGQSPFSESAGNAVVTVWRLGNLDKEASMQYTTANGSALAGVDYTTTAGTVTFAPGIKEMTIEVPILVNTLSSVNSKFTIVLSTPGEGTVSGNRLINTVKIQDSL